MHVIALDQPTLHRLQDGRFEIVRDGALAPILTGYGYVLATQAVVEILRAEGVSVPDRAAIVYDPATKVETIGYRELHVTGVISPETVDATDTSEQLWLHANEDL